jgi:hypothetical protein
MLLLLVVALARLQQRLRPERVLLRLWVLTPAPLELLLLTVERSALHLAVRSLIAHSQRLIKTQLELPDQLLIP